MQPKALDVSRVIGTPDTREQVVVGEHTTGMTHQSAVPTVAELRQGANEAPPDQYTHGGHER